MFSKKHTYWMTGAALTLALAGSLFGTGSASAQALTAGGAAGPSAARTAPATTRENTAAQLHVDLAYQAADTLAPGMAFTYEITVTNDGPGDAQRATVTLPLDANVAVDDFAASNATSFVSSLDSSAIVIQFGDLGAGDSAQATVYAHLLDSAPAALTIDSRATVNWNDTQASKESQSTAVPILIGSGTPAVAAQSLQSDATGPVAAGTILNISGAIFGSEETVSLWLNVPAGTTVAAESLGQDDTALQGTAVGLDALGKSDVDGVLTYALDTTGLPSGTYSLVGHGWDSGVEGVVTFIIQ